MNASPTSSILLQPPITTAAVIPESQPKLDLEALPRNKIVILRSTHLDRPYQKRQLTQYWGELVFVTPQGEIIPLLKNFVSSAGFERDDNESEDFVLIPKTPQRVYGEYLGTPGEECTLPWWPAQPHQRFMNYVSEGYFAAVLEGQTEMRLCRKGGTKLRLGSLKRDTQVHLIKTSIKGSKPLLELEKTMWWDKVTFILPIVTPDLREKGAPQYDPREGHDRSAG